MNDNGPEKIAPQYSTQEILALRNAAALSGILIGGRIYPFGELNDAQAADLMAWGERVIESGQTGKPLSAQDRCPSRSLQHLLKAGDPAFNWDQVRFKVTSEHCAMAAREYMRQAVVRALSDAES